MATTTSSQTPKQTLLITGASSGLGLSLALAALKAGHKVIGTARNIGAARSSHPAFASLGGVWLELDVSDPSTTAAVAAAVKEYDVSVVVNNAGYAALGPLEDFGEEEVRRQFEVNVFGAVRVIWGALGYLRERGGGCVVNVSSVAGLDALPGAALYSGSKFALEGISEALSHELAPFNIRTLIVEPGAFRTNFLTGFAPTYSASLTPAYENTPAHTTMQKMQAFGGKQAGDADKAAARILEAITREGLGAEIGDGLRLLLGPDSLVRMGNKLRGLNGSLEGCERLAKSTDIEG